MLNQRERMGKCEYCHTQHIREAIPETSDAKLNELYILQGCQRDDKMPFIPDNPLSMKYLFQEQCIHSIGATNGNCWNA
jgi:hypothetical protein